MILKIFLIILFDIRGVNFWVGEIIVVVWGLVDEVW